MGDKPQATLPWLPIRGRPYLIARWGHVAEWLRNGLQNRVHQFNSGRGLHREEGKRYFLQIEDCSLMTSEVRSVCETLKKKIAAGSGLAA